MPLALSVLVTLPAFAQYTSGGSEIQPNNYPPPLPARRGAAARLVFETIGEIPLPGPLPEGPAWADDTFVMVPVAGGIARVRGDVKATPDILSGAPSGAGAAEGWVVAPDGKRRYRTTQEGLVEAETWAKHRKRWVRDWHIVAPNSLFAPPLLLGPRVCYAGLDDQVTCVRASNGHRLWAVDLGDRISRALGRWSPSASRAPGDERALEGEILLAVPDDGASLVALDAYDGTRVATYDLPADRNRLASAPLVLPDQVIAVARQGYATEEAALLLLRLKPAPGAGPPESVPYNAPTPDATDPPGR